MAIRVSRCVATIRLVLGLEPTCPAVGPTDTTDRCCRKRHFVDAV